MKATVEKILTPCAVQLSKPWHFHGVSGTKVRMVGLRGVPEAEKAETLGKMGDFLCDKEIEIMEKWFVQGRILYAIVHFGGKPIWEFFPDRRTYALEPSRKLSAYDQIPLVRVSGGLPPMWENPLPRVEDLDTVPYFGDVPYPTKWWQPSYAMQKELADALYCHERDDIDNQERKFLRFFKTPSKTVLVVFGDCGVGKTWFAIHNMLAHRPANADFAYIDLRGRPRAADLVTAIHRELGLFLDQHINNGPDPIGALAHYLIPIAKPYFQGRNFDLNGLPERERMQETYFKLASDPSKLADYNDVRLGYYDNSGKRLFVIVDNVDNYNEEEQLTVFEYITRTLMGHEGVSVVVPLRPTSRVIISRLQQPLDIIYSNINLRSPAVSNLLERRFSRTINGKNLDLKAHLPGSIISWKELLGLYLESDSAALIRDLCSTEADIPPPTYPYRTSVKNRSYDCRHYIRLFRRLLTSDVIRGFRNIGSEYYAVHALMLRPGEPLQPQSAYLLNLFDNDLPDKTGNALVRYRVLEYFHTNTDVSALFDAYFRALGPGPRLARDVMDLFISAGLLIPDLLFESATGKEILRSVSISVAGRRHFAIVRNLWYGICVKTGMHIEPTLIKRGEEAEHAARDEVGIESQALLEFYASHGWVSDRDFLAFLYKQQDLEAKRIGEYQTDEPTMLQQTAALLEHMSSPAEILGIVYGEQLENWLRKGRTVS